MYELSCVYINKEAYVYVEVGPLSLAQMPMYMQLSSPAKTITRNRIDSMTVRAAKFWSIFRAPTLFFKVREVDINLWGQRYFHFSRCYLNSP